MVRGGLGAEGCGVCRRASAPNEPVIPTWVPPAGCGRSWHLDDSSTSDSMTLECKLQVDRNGVRILYDRAVRVPRNMKIRRRRARPRPTVLRAQQILRNHAVRDPNTPQVMIQLYCHLVEVGISEMVDRPEVASSWSLAALRLTLNHLFVVVGSTENDWDDLDEMPTGKASTWNNKHVLVSAQAQQAAVQIQLWSGGRPAHTAGKRVVFDGLLRLHDGRIRIGEPSGLCHLVCLVADGGEAHAVIWTDEADFPTEIDVWVESWHG